jgi:hypothetical protein
MPRFKLEVFSDKPSDKGLLQKRTTSPNKTTGQFEMNAQMNAQMTQAQWSTMTHAQRAAARDNSDLNKELIALEGYRVEVETTYGEKRRFIVGKSTGWKPCHLEISRRDSSSGPSTDKKYLTVKVLYKAR